MTIYLAGKFSARERLRPIRDRLVGLGYKVNSTWIDADLTVSYSSDWGTRYEAIRDTSEISKADWFILDTLDENVTGGREVELGMAYMMNKRITIVGPNRNIFHNLTQEHCQSWEEFFTITKESEV